MPFARARLVASSLFLVLAVVMTSTVTGCQIFRKIGGTVDRIAFVFDEMPSQQQLLAHLKSSAKAVSQLSSNVSVSMTGTPKIKGTLQVEFPDRMRMKAGPLSVAEMGVDVGSNSEHFWIWTRASFPGHPPAFYFASHAAFEHSAVRKSIPLDPKWLIEGLGLVRFDPRDVHYGPMMAEGGRMKFVTVHQTANGPQYRVMLLAVRTGVIEQQALYDASKLLIAYTNSSKYKAITQNNRQVSLPQRVELHMLQPNGQDTKMVLDLGSISLEPLYGNPNQMWSMPNPRGIEKIDLTYPSQFDQRSGFPLNSPAQRGPQALGAGYQR